MAHPFAPTDEQQEVVDHIAHGTGSIMINAYAGTAKTTTLRLAAPGVKGYALALAFNRKIVDELSGLMPDNFKVQSLNGVGHSAWMRTINRNEMRPDKFKLGKLLSVVAKDRKVKLLQYQRDYIRQGVEEAMKLGLSPNNIGEPLVEDTPETWQDILDEVSSDEFEFIHWMCREVLTESIATARAGQISYDDQIYCPTILGGAWPRYQTVFVDEAQDLSPLNHRMLDLISIGRVAAVGDPKQAIYKFRGADSESMTNMRRMRPSWTDLGLTMTFRCPKAIVARQQDHAPGYRAYEKNAEGRFLNAPTEVSYGEFDDVHVWRWNTVKSLLADIGAQKCAILCRNNAPLMEMAFKLIAGGVGCVMLGRDIGKGLVRLVQKLAKDESMPIVKFSIFLSEWLEKEVAIANANKKEDRAEKLTDQVECIRATITGASPKTVGDLISTLERAFSRENGQVILSTIHRAKGLEWPFVIHLDPWRIPSKQSRMAAQAGDLSHIKQEYNLRYVGETRTQHTLMNADSRSFRI